MTAREGWIHTGSDRHDCRDHRPAPAHPCGRLWRCRCGRLWTVHEDYLGGTAWGRAGPLTWLRHRKTP